MIFNFQLFDSVQALTQGGPALGTATVVWFIFQPHVRLPGHRFGFRRVGRAPGSDPPPHADRICATSETDEEQEVA